MGFLQFLNKNKKDNHENLKPAPDVPELGDIPPPPQQLGAPTEFYSELPAFPTAVEENEISAPPFESMDSPQQPSPQYQIPELKKHHELKLKEKRLGVELTPPKPDLYQEPVNFEQPGQTTRFEQPRQTTRFEQTHEQPRPPQHRPAPERSPERMIEPAVTRESYAESFTEGHESREGQSTPVYHLEKPFIEATQFAAMIDDLSELHKCVCLFNTIISELDKLDSRREGKFIEWRDSLEDIQKKLFYIDEVLFKG